MNLMASINWNSIIIVIAILTVLAIVFTMLILLVNKACAVQEDEKVNSVKEKLANANCGGCGYAGCAEFAKALCEGKAEITNCAPTPMENKEKIAEILGITLNKEPMVAVVCCMGNDESAKDKFHYIGNETCDALASCMGGDKVCPSGCLGKGGCVSICSECAVSVNNGVASIDRNACKACGSCAKNCPKHLIKLIPKKAKVYVACNSTCKGKEVMNACSVGCIGCGLCAKNCPNNAITMEDNLPKIDYSLCSSCGLCAEKCVRKCIKKVI